MNRDFGFWFAGLCDGEACFAMRALRRHAFPTLRFDITLRDDDTPLLETIRDTLGFGQIYTRKSAYTNPQGYTSKKVVSYLVWNKTDCKALADLLRQFPLRSKKQRDFKLWAEAADLWYSTNFVGWKGKNGHIAHPEKLKVIERLRELATEIVKVREYQPFIKG
jgi:hypothetical protein